MADKSSCSVTVKLFGPGVVIVQGVLLPHLRRRKGYLLLALLALHYGAEVDRNWLAEMLSPDSYDPLANLRKTIADLRKALGPEAKLICAPSRDTLTLDLTDAFVDVLTFDAAIARGDPASLEEAVALYRGPLLEGCYVDWASEKRLRCEEAYVAALERLAAGALADGDPAAAEGYLRRAVATDPLRETAQRSLMQAMAAGGKSAAASVVYHQLRALLHQEIGAEPDAATVAVYERLRPASQPRKLRIFLCHASEDKPDVRALYGKLSADGMDVWLDEINILPGQDWDHEIRKAVRNSQVVIVCLSPTSVSKSGYVQKEIRQALDVADEQLEGTIFLIPLRLHDCTVPDRLRRWHWVNLYAEDGYERLMRALKARADSFKDG
jgi:DNA-binding SARP family transcriptional activator